MADQPAYRCPACGVHSFDPQDVANRYCGNCHAFEADDELLIQTLIDKALASHKASPGLPRRELLRALRLAQEFYHRQALDRSAYPLTEGFAGAFPPGT